jgi:hypothetical protein
VLTAHGYTFVFTTDVHGCWGEVGSSRQETVYTTNTLV